VAALWTLWKAVATPEFKASGDATWPPHISWLHLVATTRGGVASSAALAYLLAVVMAQAAGPVGRAVQGVLAAPAWAPLSDLSYSAYLYHVQAHFWVWRGGLLPSGLVRSADDLGGFAADAATSLLVTFGAAFLSHRLVERPAAAAARRLERILFGTGSRSAAS
jgi:peptidoglycan/LPS O-acetylase OafA/YrhL